MGIQSIINYMVDVDGRALIIPCMGFQNTGSICYFNALMQCLLSSPTFLKFVAQKSQNEFFLEFFRGILDGKWDTIFTTRLLQLHNMVLPNQSSSEYFVRLVDLLQLEPIFETTHKLVKTCVRCGYTRRTTDKTFNPFINNTFLEFFKTEEILNSVLCDGCKTKQDVSQSRTIEGIPPVLVFSLNKYAVKRDIHYPKMFRIDNTFYKLFGTVEHHGVLGAGHYVARCVRNNQTILADDTRVTPIGDIEPTDNTYMVFYERVSV